MSTVSKVSFRDEMDIKLNRFEIVDGSVLDKLDNAGYGFVDLLISRCDGLIKNPLGHCYMGAWLLPQNMEFATADKFIRSMKTVVNDVLYVGHSGTVEDLAYYESLYEDLPAAKLFAIGEKINQGLTDYVVCRSGVGDGRILELEEYEGVRGQGIGVLVVFRRVRR